MYRPWHIKNHCGCEITIFIPLFLPSGRDLNIFFIMPNDHNEARQIQRGREGKTETDPTKLIIIPALMFWK